MEFKSSLVYKNKVCLWQVGGKNQYKFYCFKTSIIRYYNLYIIQAWLLIILFFHIIKFKFTFFYHEFRTVSYLHYQTNYGFTSNSPYSYQTQFLPIEKSLTARKMSQQLRKLNYSSRGLMFLAPIMAPVPGSSVLIWVCRWQLTYMADPHGSNT